MPEPIIPHSRDALSPDSAGLGVGLFLHAAAVAGPYGAILLMGHSSSGKTTLSSLLSTHFPLIADDLVFVRPLSDKAWTVMDGSRIKPLAYEKDRVHEYILQKGGKEYPLHAIIRIFAAHSTEMKPLSSIKTCEYLLDAVFEIDIQRERSNPCRACGWFHATALMARQYQGWQLQFTLEKQLIVSLLHKKMDEAIIN